MHIEDKGEIDMKLTIEDSNVKDGFKTGDLISLVAKERTGGHKTYTGIVTEVPQSVSSDFYMLVDIEDGKALYLGDVPNLCRKYNSLPDLQKALEDTEDYFYTIHSSQRYELVMKQLKEEN